MSDFSQGPGWWMASDGKWYAPEAAAGYVAPVEPTFVQPAMPSPPPPPAGLSSPGFSSGGFSSTMPPAPTGFPAPAAPMMPGQAMPTPAMPRQAMPTPAMPAPAGFPQYAPPGASGGFMPGAPANTGSNGAAIAALILGIIAILTGWFFLGVLFAVGGIVCGLIGIKKSKAAGKGKAMSIIGIVLSILAIASAIAVGFGIKKVVDSVDTADPNDYSITTASCVVAGGYLDANGEMTNKTSDSKNFMISIDGGSFGARTVVELAAGETQPWKIYLPVDGSATCGKTNVANFFSGSDFSS